MADDNRTGSIEVTISGPGVEIERGKLSCMDPSKLWRIYKVSNQEIAAANPDLIDKPEHVAALEPGQTVTIPKRKKPEEWGVKKAGEVMRVVVSKPKCPYCGKDSHHITIQPGNWDGDGGTLGDKIMKNMKAQGLVDKADITAHPWYFRRQVQTQARAKNPIRMATSIQAHHVICCEVPRESSKIASLMNNAGYDINHCRNGMWFPYLMDMACMLAVPLHRGGHKSGRGFAKDDADLDEDGYMKDESQVPWLAYPKAVSEKVGEVRMMIESGALCSRSRWIRQKFDSISRTVSGYLLQFRWTITSDGMDYQRGSAAWGCGGVRDPGGLADKSGPCLDRRHADDQQLSALRAHDPGIGR